MSHNPNTVKSQDDINEGGRKSDVLIEAISKAERLQKQLDIAVKALEEYADENYYLFPTYRNGHERAKTALKEIKELNNVSR